MKPKENKGYNLGTYDECQTPPYALKPLLPYLNTEWRIWDSACGKGTLTRYFQKLGWFSVGTDILVDKYFDFFSLTVGQNFVTDPACIVTNPPYSIKYDWLERCYELGLPFALLLPVETIGAKKAQDLFDKYGVRIIFVQPRVDFYMPEKGYTGGGAQFPTAWFTWKLNLPKEINFARLNKPKRSELGEYWKEAFSE